MSPLRTWITTVREGGRVTILDNTLWAGGDTQACATVRVLLMQDRAIEVPGCASATSDMVDPTIYPVRHRAAPHGRPWFLDAMETRLAERAVWYRLKQPVIEGAGPLARVLGPADWAHGIFRPVQDLMVADPNPNLSVHLVRPPRGDWIGLRPRTHWEPHRGIGMGSAAILDVEGDIGTVSMMVALGPLSAGRP